MVFTFLQGFSVAVQSSAVSPTQASTQTILVLGDSLSAGYGIKIDDSWPALLQRHLAKQKFPYRIVNVSISGQTSAEGLAQIDGLLEKHHPALVILELGANDGLRGLAIEEMRRNLAIMITKAQEANADVLLMGMHVPPNYGKRYSEAFHAVFSDLAQQFKTGLVPFMLTPVATQSKWIQEDGLHPTADAQPILMNYFWPYIKPMLKPAG